MITARGARVALLGAIAAAGPALAGCGAPSHPQAASQADVECRAVAGPPGSAAHEQCLAAARQQERDNRRELRTFTDRVRR